jgi:N utilization substance protein B
VTNVDHDSTGTSARIANVARSAARLNAVQALYQMAISGGTAETIIRQFAAAGPSGRIDGDEPIAEADTALFALLVRGTRGSLAEVDEMLSACLDDAWPAERMEVLLRAILRCGAYELSSQPAVPARVVISEYVRVADAFFASKEPALVNAVLDRLGRVLRPEELAAEGSRQ